MNRVLSTKILPTNLRQMLLNAGLSIVEANFIETHPVTFTMPAPTDLLLFTSQNAVGSVIRHPESHSLKATKTMCVGIKTKALLEENGFIVIESEDYADELAKRIVAKYSERSVAFFSGNLRRDTLPDALTSAGISFTETVVYETLLTPQKISAQPNGILFFSPSGVESFLKYNEITTETCFCIGTTTADALSGITKNIIIANRPTVENTIIQCINHYKTSQS
ncbi:MAG: uroporphyrinogen-III synthase [Flavobacterium sp.]|nr:uroporphyrinogen-III synthase [Flavobacterium sp.]